MVDVEKVSEFIDGAGMFFLSTDDAGQPKCRPMRSHYLEDGKLYFATGRFKDVFQQMQANPQVEILAIQGGMFLRYWGRAVFEDTYDRAERILDGVPQAREVYTMEDDMMLEVFHLEDAHAEIHNMVGVVEFLDV